MTSGGRLMSDLPELDLDLLRRDPALALDPLRPHRVVRSVRGLEVIGHDLGQELLADNRLRTFSPDDYQSHGATPGIAEFIDKGVFLHMEPERHREMRMIFMRAFGRRQMETSGEAIVRICDGLSDRLAARGEGDLVHDFTVPLASYALGELVGFPRHDMDELVAAALELRKIVYLPLEPHVDAIERALQTLHDYCAALLEARRQQPRDDFLGVLIDEHQVKGRLSGDELVWGTVNLFLAGIDTTSFQLASTLHNLITSGAWDPAAADPALRDAVIEESKRLTPVATLLHRVANEPLEIDGVEAPAGQGIKINMTALGRDPARFADPHAFRVDRQPPAFPVIFGNGVHACIGRSLAQAELRSGLAALTRRLTAVAFTTSPAFHPWTDTFYGPANLPVSFRSR